MSSDYNYFRTYRGKVKALVLDWSGTLADAYVIAPAVVFVEVFKNQGVDISMEEARGPMGLRKDLHIKKLTEDPVIAARWEKIKGKAPDQSDVDAMFADFVPLQLDCLRKYTDLLPGIADVCNQMQKDGIKIGASTGFVRSMVDILLQDSIRQGFTPDATVAGDEVINGARPAPHMVYKNLDVKTDEKMSTRNLIREMNTPEVKQGISFMLKFLSNISKQQNIKGEIQ